MDRYLVSGAIFVLVFEVIWFLNDFRIIHVPIFDRTESVFTKPTVGKIVEVKRGVRRRAQDSIVWEESSEKDVLYNFDSVLTLPQSSATVTLKNDTKIIMSENTLILIENQEEQSDSKVRLRFAKGDLRTKGEVGTEIATEEWTVDAQAGSELNLRQVEGGKVEVEVLKGEAKLKNEKRKEEKSISQGKILALKKDQIVEEKVMSAETKWITRDGLRIYTFHLPASLEFEWSGEADSIWHLLPDKKVENIKLNGENKKNLELISGTHSLRLYKGATISKTVQISVWRAPVMHLLSPLPRDRVRPGEEIPFSWNGTRLAKKYKLQFSDKADFSSVISEMDIEPAFVKLNLKREGLFYWRIIGVDELGYQIPSLYSNPIYNYKDLLEAPIIKSPKARQPANQNQNPEGASFNFLKFYKLFFEVANAAELYDVIFEWEPVNGAEHYMVEIDNDGTFRNPITMVKSESSRFVWTNAPLGKYYWRVSAGRGDTLGRFSVPQRIDLAQVLRNSKVGEEQGITMKPVEPPPVPAPRPPSVAKIELPKKNKIAGSAISSPPPKKAELEPVVAKTASKIVPPPPLQPRPKGGIVGPPLLPQFRHQVNFDFFLGAGYDQKSLGAPTDLKVNLSTLGTPMAGFGFAVTMPDEKTLIFDLRLSTATWKPKDPTDFPAQSDIVESTWRNHFFWKSRKVTFGLVVNSISLVEHFGSLDQIKFVNATMMGVGGRHVWRNFTHDLTLTSDFSDRGEMEVWIGSNYRVNFEKWNFRVIADFYSRSGKNEPSGFGVFIGPALGAEW
ncbi:MAG: hypothetical protein A4S09_11945 [Proteobacteria bacterium SG_bin7]|nr:MAG: hypothetical protein A4S09_11945 [Proteobacteria bacterium SG_bin7]